MNQKLWMIIIAIVAAIIGKLTESSWLYVITAFALVGAVIGEPNERNNIP